MQLIERLARPNRERSVVIAANSPRVRRIERQVRRLLIVRGQMSTTQLMKAIYGSPTQHWHYERVRRAARKFAAETHRRRSRGMPIVCGSCADKQSAGSS
jgi:hypothetical protein